jgi:biotin--protein ligase
MQYIAGLAVVDALRSLPGYEQLDLCIKWPNDIMVGPKHSGDNTVKKVGGVLITSTFKNNMFSLIIGVGESFNSLLYFYLFFLKEKRHGRTFVE